jgi:hypothetical protein
MVNRSHETALRAALHNPIEKPWMPKVDEKVLFKSMK